MKEIKKLIEALEKGDEKLLLSDVSCSFTIGDLKEIIINAMTKQYEILENDEDDKNYQLDDWQINDVKRHYFKEWLENYN
jgi:hypothetical protein